MPNDNPRNGGQLCPFCSIGILEDDGTCPYCGASEDEDGERMEEDDNP